jgi:hypothetical protein
MVVHVPEIQKRLVLDDLLVERGAIRHSPRRLARLLVVEFSTADAPAAMRTGRVSS